MLPHLTGAPLNALSATTEHREDGLVDGPIDQDGEHGAPHDGEEPVGDGELPEAALVPQPPLSPCRLDAQRLQT